MDLTNSIRSISTQSEYNKLLQSFQTSNASTSIKQSAIIILERAHPQFSGFTPEQEAIRQQFESAAEATSEVD